MALSRRQKITLDALIAKYSKRQDLIVLNAIQAVIREMDLRAEEIAYLFSGRTLRRGRYLPADVVKTIERISSVLNAKVKEILIGSISDSIAESEVKNNAFELFTFRREDGSLPRGAGKIKIQGPYGNKKGLTTAVRAHISRKQKGLNFTSRIWKLSNQWKSVISKTLTEGLQKGTAARKLVPQMRSALRNNTFQQNPGRGVYKSPVKNAMRLIRTENNIAYANADYERWQMIETVVAIEVRLSNRHPEYDICDSMKGKYPKSFKFILWHPNCLCIAVPVLASQRVRDALMDYKLGLTNKKPEIKQLTKLPNAAVDWMRENSARVARWKTTPLWVSENSKIIASLFR